MKDQAATRAITQARSLVGTPRRLALTVGAIGVLVAAQLGIGLVMLDPPSEGFALAFAAVQIFVGLIAARLAVVLAHVLRAPGAPGMPDQDARRPGRTTGLPPDGDEGSPGDP